MSGCVKVTHLTERGGGVGYKVKIQEPMVTRIDPDLSGCNMAFLPFASRTGAVSIDLDLAFANRKLDVIVGFVKGRSKKCKVVSPNKAQQQLSKSGLIQPYAQALRNYATSGMIDESVIRKVANALGVDMLIQTKLLRFDADISTNQFRAARVRFIAFSKKTGRVAYSVESSGAAKKFDTRFTHKSVKRDHSSAALYTMIAGGIGAVGLLVTLFADDNDLTPVGISMMIPAAGIPLARRDGEVFRKEEGDHYDKSSRGMSVQAGFSKVLHKGLVPVLKLAGLYTRRSGQKNSTTQVKPMSVGERTGLNDPSSDPKSLTGLMPICQRLCKAYVGLDYNTQGIAARRKALQCTKRCVQYKDKRYRACLRNAAVPGDVHSCESLPR